MPDSPPPWNHDGHAAPGLTRRRFLAVAAAAPFCLGSALGGVRVPGYCLRGRVWPGPGLAVLERGVVLVRDGRLEAVLRDEPGFTVPDWAQAIEFPSMAGDGSAVVTMLPGLLDAHTHKAWSPEDRRQCFLLAGVTGIGDLAAPLDRLDDLARDGFTDREGNELPAARASWSGPMLTAPGGYPLGEYGPQWGLAVDSPRTASHAVATLAGLGARMVKLGFEPGNGSGREGRLPVLSEEAARAAVAEARRLGLVVRCHCQDLSGLERALDVGVDVVEHVPDRWTVSGGEARPVYAGGLDRAEPVPELAELVRRMAGQGVAWTPTLAAGAKRTWLVRGMQSAVALFAGLGGRVVLGTDAGFLGIEPGLPLAEMKLLAGCGLGGGQIWEAGTTNAARACGFSRLGKLEPGMDADLLAAAHAPGEDPVADPFLLAGPDRLLLAMSRGRPSSLLVTAGGLG